MTTVGWVGFAALAIMACSSPAPRPVLPAATGSYRHIDNAIEVRLPDSGGYTVNGQQVPADLMVAQLRAIFAPQDSTRRAIFVWDNPRRPWADVARADSAARAAGGRAFDAPSSGWTGFTVVQPPAVGR